MLLEHIRLCNFRPYEQVELNPDSRFNIIYGLNGQGKTSVLESIGLLTFLRSFRNAKNSEMLRIGSSEGLVSGVIRNGDISVELAVKLAANRKQATLNGKFCKYLSEYIGKVSAVSFSPSDIDIIRGSPENRRLWLDKLVQVFEPEHSDAVARYQKIIEHRNRLLKAVADGQTARLPDDFGVWTEELRFWGAKIIHNRIHTVDKSVNKISSYYNKISSENIDVTIGYSSSVFNEVPGGHPSPSSLELIDQFLKDSLAVSLPKECIVGTTLVGPHRDDIEIKMDGHSARSFGSQGEVRSLVLAMRLTEVEAFNAVQRLKPILLIDDFSSELDAIRRKFLLEYLVESGSQVFLSTTEELSLGKTFLVNEGRIIPHEHGHATDRRQQL